MIVWVLTYNDGDYYSTYDEYLSVHASKEAAQDAAKALADAEHERNSKHNYNRGEVGEWVSCPVADKYTAYPDGSELHYAGSTWYVFPEEI